MQQFTGIMTAPSLLLSSLLGALVVVAMILGCRRAPATKAGCRLILVVAICGFSWAVLVIATAPLR